MATLGAFGSKRSCSPPGPPAQVRAFAQSRGTRAKTDWIGAELIARFFAFRTEAGCKLPTEKYAFSEL